MLLPQEVHTVEVLSMYLLQKPATHLVSRFSNTINSRPLLTSSSPIPSMTSVALPATQQTSARGLPFTSSKPMTEWVQSPSDLALPPSTRRRPHATLITSSPTDLKSYVKDILIYGTLG